jgi:hypothetical protein
VKAKILDTSVTVVTIVSAAAHNFKEGASPTNH